ncbi:hypothetical protein predicted by Glimmer/Critica [Salmonella enterica subsp. enterica serovar Weltevreden str. 2007-60-3289-1]|nr:hypothetical protein predicted by Glimmer/Critica [Salmonella enterica subsp. enterica serovar Weltevreden str. 2007-60-3289-1]
MAVYPRWRGEHIVVCCGFEGCAGLSPLARGTQVTKSITEKCGRFIPAGAGNTYDRTTPIRKTTVYPRWRGEHNPAATSPSGASGLSPLARGTPEDKK